MKFTEKQAEWVQLILHYYYNADDCPQPGYLLGTHDFVNYYTWDAIEAYQFFVDILYRLLKSNLLEIWPEGMLVKEPIGSEFHELTYDGIEGLCQALVDQNPYDNETCYKLGVWNDPIVHQTDTTISLIKEYFTEFDAQGAHGINWPFIQKVEQILKEHNMEWDNKPLFPIKIQSVD